jgi:ferredoxin
MPINAQLTEELRGQARQLLEARQLGDTSGVDCVIGYEISPRGGSRPTVIRDPAEVERLVWGDDCVHNLVTYLHDNKKSLKRGEKPPRVAVVLKPCDSRAVNVLLAERQIARERVLLIGIVCEGLRDSAGALELRCARCAERVPVIYDVLLGVLPQETPVNEPDDKLARIERMEPGERLEFWLAEFDRCIRCYACRQVCPGCYCTTCMFERDDGLWVDAGIGLSQKHLFHLGRALHLAGRCVECQECERVCPMGLPLSLLNRLLAREVDELYGHRAGVACVASPLLFELGTEEALK